MGSERSVEREIERGKVDENVDEKVQEQVKENVHPKKVEYLSFSCYSTYHFIPKSLDTNKLKKIRKQSMMWCSRMYSVVEGRVPMDTLDSPSPSTAILNGLTMNVHSFLRNRMYSMLFGC